MNGDELRASCLGLPGTIETASFGPGIAVFKASNGRMFAVGDLEADPPRISLKCDPDLAAALRRDHESIIEGYHLNKRHWITVTMGGDASDELVAALIEDSHALVGPKR